MTLTLLALAGAAAPVPIVVEPNRVLNRITPAMFGSCIEDVNHEIYGGLYAQRLFGESFEEPTVTTGPAGWRAMDGEWASRGEEIQGPAGSGPKLVLSRPGFADGTVEAQVRVSGDAPGNAGLLVRVSRAGVGADAFDGYEVSLDASAHTIVLGKHRHDFRALRTVPAPVSPGEWHRLRVALTGPRMSVFLDEEAEPRIDYTDRERPLLTGGVALRTWQTGAAFRAVKVDGKAVSPELVDGGVSGMWDAIHTGDASAQFALDPSGAFNGERCQRIVRGAGTGAVGVANRGLNRWGVPVRQGHPMEGRIYLRAQDLAGPVTVALQSADGTRTYATGRITGVGTNWKRFALNLRPNATDPNARFVVLIDEPGTLWIDQAVLMDGKVDRFHGLPVRGDIARALVNERLTFLRYGGTMVNVPGYRWKKMIGDPDRRPPYRGHWYPYSTNGFGIFEFLRFCEAAEFGAAFAINVEETPEDAADLADYLTAPVTNPWGRRRAEDGHPAPYRLDYLELGNEEAISDTSPAALAHYAERYRLLAKAIHSRNPRIKLVGAAWWVPDLPAMKTVFDAMDGSAAAWDLHFWSDDANSGTAIDREIGRARALFKRWNPNTNLKVVVFEENGNLHNQQRALGHATTLHATRRHGDFVLADCAANCLQPWGQNDNGWDQGQVFFTPSHVWGMPPYDAQWMAARNHLPLRVATAGGEGLDVLATRSEDGKTLVLSVVNVADKVRTAKVSLNGYQSSDAQAWTLAGPLDAVNPPNGPKAVVSQVRPVNVGSELTFAPHSFTVVRMSLTRKGG